MSCSRLVLGPALQRWMCVRTAFRRQALLFLFFSLLRSAAAWRGILFFRSSFASGELIFYGPGKRRACSYDSHAEINARLPCVLENSPDLWSDLLASTLDLGPPPNAYLSTRIRELRCCRLLWKRDSLRGKL
jgi:hypothetical protein